GPTNDCKIRLVNPWRDETYLRNDLAYGLFKQMADSPDKRRDGIPVSWTEVFVNGHYYGLLEVSPAVRTQWLELEPFVEGQMFPTLAYKQQRSAITLAENNKYMMRQIEPSRRHGTFNEPLVELLSSLEESKTEEFLQEIKRSFNLDQMVDFYILMQFTQNYNGYPDRFVINDILVKEPGPNGKFFLVPYDFDDTLGDLDYDDYNTEVFDRLLEEHPLFKIKVAERWQDLRKNIIVPEKIERDLRKKQKLLEDFIQWDIEHWRKPNDLSYEEHVDELIENIRTRIKELDKRYTLKK
ncbi:MAG: hypothetical protein GX811_05135, partial [Lentisphaerae bacterium]|nr:hypothetical protein [Lentisphaerota bacterium]